MNLGCFRGDREWFREHSNSGALSYTDGMTSKVGPKGQVVIPKAMRERIGLRPGDEVTFELEGRAVRVEPASSGAPLRGRLQDHDLVGMLEAEHRAEPQ